MAKLGDLNPQATHYTFTRCPGTDVYMPPEAVKDEPVYTEMVDCFSLGVVIVHILTRQFPKPGNRGRKVENHPPGMPQGKVEILLAEVDRRQDHISQVDPNHPLLPIALDCLKDVDIERPSAQQLCERLASLKERPVYSDSVEDAQQESQQLKRQLQQLQPSLASEREETDRLIQQLQQLQQRSAREREEKETQVGQLRQQLCQLQQSLARERKESESELQQFLALQREAIEQITITRDARERQLNQQIESLEQERTKLKEEFHELEEQLLIWESQAEGPLWSEGEKAPFADRRRRDAVVDGNRVYFLDGNGKIWACDISYMYWSQLSVAPYFGSGLTILNGLPTTVGGDLTNKLMSLTMLTMEGKWIERFPPMPTKQKYVTALCIGTALIVGGGSGGNYQDKSIVEVLDIDTHQWSTALYLPESLHSCSATVCGDQLYMLGGMHNSFPSKSVYSCSVSALFQTCSHKSSLEVCTSVLSLSNSSRGSRSIWNKLADLPVTESTCVTSYGQLLAVGGEDSDYNTTTAVYMYNPSTNSWNVISHMITARRCCFATVLPSNQLMVVGGEIDSDGTLTDSVEFGLL